VNDSVHELNISLLDLIDKNISLVAFILEKRRLFVHFIPKTDISYNDVQVNK